MKRQTAVPITLGMLERTLGVNPDSNDNVAALLRDIRDELRQNNEALRNMKARVFALVWGLNNQNIKELTTLMGEGTIP